MPAAQTHRRVAHWLAGGFTLYLGLAAAPRAGTAQQTFTQQIVLVPVFQGADRKLADAVGDALRSRLQRAYRRPEVSVISERAVATLLQRSSIDPQTADTFHLRTLARHLRADEVISGTAERRGAVVHAWARLNLTRDQRLQQPIAAVQAPTADSAGALLARAVVASRRQLNSHRRCENALRDGGVDAALAEARAGTAGVPDGVILKACLVNALVASGAGGREVLAESQRILAAHPESYWGLDGAARAYDALGDKEHAAQMWLRLAATDTTELPLARRVVTALLHGGNAPSARPLIVRLSDASPDDLELLRLRWQVLFAVRDWGEACRAGDRLANEDKLAREDSTFVLRLATAHRARGDTVKAVAVAAAGVTRFPRDARLYVLYSELVQADSRIVVDRGLRRFPNVAELHLLRAQELRRAGKNAEAVAPFEVAIKLDPTLGQGYLALAQTQVDLGMFDSAHGSARRALVAGEDTGTIAQFALARGNALFRAANSTKQRSDYQLALRFLALADSLNGTPQSRFLVGATALSISQSAATDAPTARDCALSRMASDLLPLAREKITAGAQVAPDASRQYLDYMDQLEPVVAQQVATLCAGG